MSQKINAVIGTSLWGILDTSKDYPKAFFKSCLEKDGYILPFQIRNFLSVANSMLEEFLIALNLKQKPLNSYNSSNLTDLEYSLIFGDGDADELTDELEGNPSSELKFPVLETVESKWDFIRSFMTSVEKTLLAEYDAEDGYVLYKNYAPAMYELLGLREAMLTTKQAIEDFIA